MAFNRGRTGGFDSSGGQQFPPNYDASPGQFSGTQQEGGFIGTQESSSSPARPSPKRGGGYIQTLTPVTIRQLYNATQALSDDVFKVDGKELNQVEDKAKYRIIVDVLFSDYSGWASSA
jgi:hypothetical protein